MEQIKIEYTKPPNFGDIGKVFPAVYDKVEQVVFAYGDRLYCPRRMVISEDVLVHESVHLRQQGGTQEGAEAWWKRYLAEPSFRRQQEIEAYRAQYHFFCSKNKDRNAQAKFLWQKCKEFSSPLYGSIISHGAAVQAMLRK